MERLMLMTVNYDSVRLDHGLCRRALVHGATGRKRRAFQELHKDVAVQLNDRCAFVESNDQAWTLDPV